ncbi:E3 SUMO-protein ligase ZBED1-like, partial [Xyrichtys novacula]
LFEETFALPKQKDSFVSLNDQAGDEIRKYKEANPLALTRKPLCWWSEHQAAIPLLSSLARSILCIPGTSVAAERVFSTAGDIREVLFDLSMLSMHKNLKMC